jgi:tetratricopeptide (TPR) repeat protein
MASLIPGYEYDIFISYRQKDNKHDGWVTEFVSNLKAELESMFKEDISVFFDINPHDGLLETYDVDASLKEKLRCLIFIPVISRTYCDPKSFAWEHEFKAFVELASKDQFGLKVKLPNGNVASRVLPIRIHDIDPADVRLFELIHGGLLRGIEFVYEESGVNRPLTSDDDENRNLNKTKYKNQINKVALTISEIIQGLETEPEWQKLDKRIEDEEFSHTKELLEKRTGLKKKDGATQKKLVKLISVAIALIVFGVIILLFWPKIFNKSTLDKLRSSGERVSVAIMPFQNMTSDSTKNFWQEMIQDNLITSLSGSEELKVRQIESISRLIHSKGLAKDAAVPASVANMISQKLDADVFISGSINQAGSAIRLNAQLIDSKTSDVLKSFQMNGNTEKILSLTDSLSRIIKDFLLLSTIKKELPFSSNIALTTNSPEAFRYYLYARKENARWNYDATQSWLYQAISIDSNFVDALIMLSYSFGNEFLFQIATRTYGNEALYDSAKKYSLRAYKIKDRVSLKDRIGINLNHANYFETPNEQIVYLKQLLNIDNQDPSVYFSLGNGYFDLNQYDKAIPVYEKAIEIYDKWGIKPYWVFYYTSLGECYRKTHQYKKAITTYKQAEKNFPDDPSLIYNQALLYYDTGDSVMGNKFVDKGVSFLRNISASEANISAILASAWAEVGLMDKADKYYRKALSLEPGSPVNLNNLAYFLIDKDRNIDEGMALADKALKLRPGYYPFLYTKGLGFYKLGKYHEALDLLQESWDLRMKDAIYDHNAFLHLEAAKKAVSNIK